MYNYSLSHISVGITIFTVPLGPDLQIGTWVGHFICGETGIALVRQIRKPACGVYL